MLCKLFKRLKSKTHIWHTLVGLLGILEVMDCYERCSVNIMVGHTL